jgi:guanine nucleotide-binding protein G(i) subunit alpha
MDERDSYKEIIFSNTVQSMRVLLEGLNKMGIQLDASNRGRYDSIMTSPSQIEGDTMPPTLTDAVHGLWNDAGVRKAYQRRNELQINDSAP